jgi:GST-like protein
LHILLEELGVPWRLHPVNIRDGEQFRPEFAGISPNHKIPVLEEEMDDGGRRAVFESGAIMIHLAQRHGRFWPTDDEGRLEGLQWMMFQMASVGPMFGQANHFAGGGAPERVPYAIDRYLREARRLHVVMEQRLSTAGFFLPMGYSIVDMAVFPWIRVSVRLGIDLAGYPALQRWFDAIQQRPAVERALDLFPSNASPLDYSARAREVLFGLGSPGAS